MLDSTGNIKVKKKKNKPRRISRKRLKSWLIPIISLSIFALIWELVARAELVSTLLLPPISEVIAELIEQLGPGDERTQSFLMVRHIGHTVYALILGFVIASIISTALGLLMGINRTVYQWLNPIVAFFMPIPTVAIVPVVILWLGLGMQTVVFIVALGASFPIIYTAASGVQSTPKKQIWAAEITGANYWQILFRVLIPGSMPYLIAGHKLALGRAWRGVIAGEIFAATKYGVGFMIFDARTFLDTKSMYAGLIVVGVIGLLLEKIIFQYIERITVVRWGITADMDI